MLPHPNPNPNPNPSPSPRPDSKQVGGAVGPSDAADFVTGSVVLNRMHRAVNQVPLPLPAYPYPYP